MTVLESSGTEAARLAKLLDYQVLDTPPEREFDEITAAAARLFNMPISLVSLVDGERQWFKARYGLAEKQTPRQHAFCAHAISSDDLFVVPDATQDPRFADNPLVTGDPNIRFYAGAPLVTPDNFRLGTLCVIDTKPHQAPNEDQRTILTMLARLVVRELENRRIARRAEHQAQMAARLAEAVIALMAAADREATLRAIADHARRLCVPDAARTGVIGAPPADATWATRAEADVSAVRWEQLDQTLAIHPPGQLVTQPPAPGLMPERSAWAGARLGRTGQGATFQVWRRLTSSFTEMETVMLSDFVTAASVAVDRFSR
jgi:GAF domain-containing protein